MAKSHVPTKVRAKRPRTFIQRSREVSPEEKAIFHNVTGAGRSHVKRPFMDLNADDEDVLTKAVEDGIDRLLAGERL